MRGSAGDVPTLRALVESDVPCVVAPFTDDASQADVAEAATTGMDVLEARIDLFSRTDSDHVVTTVGRLAATVPTIATIRSAIEGGGWRGDDADRLALFRSVAPHVDGLDIEGSSTAITAAVVEAAHSHGACAIVSFHDFVGMPPVVELTERARRANDLGADLVKIAVTVASPDELRALASFTLDLVDLGVVVIGMGPHGAPSRVAFPFLGSRLTFAVAGRSTAPGQLPLAEMATTLRRLSPGYAARHPRTR